jgi:uncharacterized surface protein with fasciclin (FAS1) repeats
VVRYFLANPKKRNFIMKIFNAALLMGFSTLALSACSSPAPETAPADDTTVVQDETLPSDTAMADGTTSAAPENIVMMAQGNPQVSTLVSAVTAAGLGETLSGPGPFTVFAPTNSAFDKIDKATLDGLMKPENKTKLADLLKYHVVSGKVTSADVAKMIADGNGTATIKTMGGNLKATMEGGKVMLTDAKGGKSAISGADMMASNGIVHTIDTVVMP